VSAQAVDTAGNVVASISDKGQKWSKKECAVAAGKAFAKLLQDKNVDQIAFDRNGFLYHGRVAAFADGMREGGIKL
jgi:large subunit ribosomal protein L18